jgi:hypothetical protein
MSDAFIDMAIFIIHTVFFQILSIQFPIKLLSFSSIQHHQVFVGQFLLDMIEFGLNWTVVAHENVITIIGLKTSVAVYDCHYRIKIF